MVTIHLPDDGRFSSPTSCCLKTKMLLPKEARRPSKDAIRFFTLIRNCSLFPSSRPFRKSSFSSAISSSSSAILPSSSAILPLTSSCSDILVFGKCSLALWRTRQALIETSCRLCLFCLSHVTQPVTKKEVVSPGQTTNTHNDASIKETEFLKTIGLITVSFSIEQWSHFGLSRK